MTCLAANPEETAQLGRDGSASEGHDHPDIEGLNVGYGGEKVWLGTPGMDVLRVLLLV
jgi:hypothetical protein